MKKERDRKIWMYLLLGLLLGFLIGAMFVYKVEINTIEQALDSLDYCYKTYAIGK